MGSTRVRNGFLSNPRDSRLEVSETTVTRSYMGLSENRLNPKKPNGFADHYPYTKWLFHWGYTPFSDIPLYGFTLFS